MLEAMTSRVVVSDWYDASSLGRQRRWGQASHVGLTRSPAARRVSDIMLPRCADYWTMQGCAAAISASMSVVAAATVTLDIARIVGPRGWVTGLPSTRSS
jgi:hypothetical protein